MNNIMDYFVKNNIISNNLVFFHKGVRDDPNIDVYKCINTGALVLNKIKAQDYENKSCSYWNSNNIIEARKKTLFDDERRYESIKDYKIENLLDFGCGNGGLLKFCSLNENFKNLYGIELNGDIIEILNKEGINTYSDINLLPKTINFNIIMLNHVLEHLHDPIKLLKDIREIMHDNTQLIIEIPHAKDFLIDSYECESFKNFTFWSEHLILHTETSLRNLLKIIGFSKIEVSYYQRYNIFNHLNWLNNGTPGGDKNNKINDKNLILAYNSFLEKYKKTDTIIAYCYK